MGSFFEPADPQPAIAAALEAQGVAVAELRERLARYGALVLEGNRRANLSAARTPDAIAAHLLDSLSVLPFVAAPYVDVGSGAGFPAIAVALAAGFALTLIESTRKKARFLEEACASQGLTATVIAERAELSAHRADLRERFASTTCRAVGSATLCAELTLPLLAVGGVAILQRGRLETQERAALEDASLVLGGRMESEHPLSERRCIVVLRKVAPTPWRFPRRAGATQRRPLCG